MAILFVGTQLKDYDTISGAVDVINNSSVYDNVYSRSAVGFNTGAFVSKVFDPLPAFWFTYRNCTQAGANPVSGKVSFQFFVGVQSVLRGQYNASKNVEVSFWNGASWTLVATFTWSAKQHIVLNVVPGPNGKLECFTDGSKIGEYNGNLASLIGINTLRFDQTHSSSNTTHGISEVLLATHPLTYARVKTIYPTAAGTYSGMVGDVSLINDAIAIDSEFISSPSPGQRASFNLSPLPSNSLVPTFVKAVLRGRKGVDGGPQGVDTFLRIGGEDHFVPMTDFPSELFADRGAGLPTNPKTGQPWTQADFAGIEMGVRSKA